MKRFVQINKSVKQGTLPKINYSGFELGEHVTLPDGAPGYVTDVRFINTPSSALYYVYVHTSEGERSFYPEQLRKFYADHIN